MNPILLAAAGWAEGPHSSPFSILGLLLLIVTWIWTGLIVGLALQAMLFLLFRAQTSLRQFLLFVCGVAIAVWLNVTVESF